MNVVFQTQSNALTKLKSKAFRLHQAIRLLVIMNANMFLKQLHSSLRHNRNSTGNSNGTFMHPND